MGFERGQSPHSSFMEAGEGEVLFTFDDEDDGEDVPSTDMSENIPTIDTLRKKVSRLDMEGAGEEDVGWKGKGITFGKTVGE